MGMNAADLRMFCAKKGWSRAELARRLEVSPNRMTAMTAGRTPIPRYIRLALAALDSDLEPYGEG